MMMGLSSLVPMATKIMMLIVLIRVVSATLTCATKKEGEAYRATANAKTLTGEKFVWKRRVMPTSGSGDEEEATVLECDVQGVPSKCSSPEDRENYSGLLYYANNRYVATLIVQSVSRAKHDAIWSWNDGNNTLGECRLIIRDNIPPMVCEEMYLTQDNSALEWTCSVPHVYPEANRCSARYSMNRGGESVEYTPIPLTAQLTQTASRTVPTFYYVTCFLRVDISLLPEGLFSFSMSAVLTDRAGSVFSTTENVNLVLPQPKLKSCPLAVDLGRNGAPQTCVCVPNGNAYPLVETTSWLDAQGSNVGQKGGGDDISILTFIDGQRSDPQVTYTCRGVSALGQNDLIYKPYLADSTTVTKFEANSQTEELEVSRSSYVTLVCEAKGHPIPWINIVNKRTGQALSVKRSKTSDSSAMVSFYNRIDTCTEMADTFTCIADNGMGTHPEERSLRIFVKCRLEIDPDAEVMNYTDGNVFTLKLPVIGYPGPTRMWVTKFRKEYDHDDEIDPLHYTLEYTPGTSSRGTITFTLPADVKDDVYTLHISTGRRYIDYDFNAGTAAEDPGWIWRYYENSDDDDSSSGVDLNDLSKPVIAAICLGFGLVMCLVFSFVCWKLGMRRNIKMKRTDPDSSNHQTQQNLPEEDIGFRPANPGTNTNANNNNNNNNNNNDNGDYDFLNPADFHVQSVPNPLHQNHHGLPRSTNPRSQDYAVPSHDPPIHHHPVQREVEEEQREEEQREEDEREEDEREEEREEERERRDPIPGHPVSVTYQNYGMLGDEEEDAAKISMTMAI